MMRHSYIFLIFIVYNCSGFSLPTKLKCVDNLCKNNISTGRMLQQSNILYGQFSEIKKNSVVRIMGKNVENNELLWLIEYDGFYGFVEYKFLKENSNSVITTLDVVSNPYNNKNKRAEEKTGNHEDDEGIKLFSKIDDAKKLDHNYEASKISEKDATKNYEDHEHSNDAVGINSSTKPSIADLVPGIIDTGLDDKIGSNDLIEGNSGNEEKGLHSVRPTTDITEVTDSTLEKKDNSPSEFKITDIEDNQNGKELDGSIKIDAIPNNSDVLDKDSEPWDTSSDGRLTDPTEERLGEIRSPFLILILKIERLFHKSAHYFIKRTGLDSCLRVKEFVHTWLHMSLENLVMGLSVLSSLFAVVFTPKVLRLQRNWQWECEKQSHLVVELEARLLSADEVRVKMCQQNHGLETLIGNYDHRLKVVGEEAVLERRAIEMDLDRVRTNYEEKIEGLRRDLLVSVEQCSVMEAAVMEKEGQLEALHADVRRMREDFSAQLSGAKEAAEVLEQRLLEVDELRKTMEEVSREKSQLEKEKEDLLTTVSCRIEEISRLNDCFGELRMFEGLGEEEYRSSVHSVLESRELRVRLKEAQDGLDDLRAQLERAVAQIRCLEESDSRSQELVKEREEQGLQAAKERDAAETKLRVLTEYFREKEVEMQRSLGLESVQKCLSVDRGETYRNKVENLESERESLTRTVTRLKVEVKECQSFAVKCKNDANTQLANAFLNISNLERELMREKDESRKLRSRLSQYVGSVASNHAHDRPQGGSDSGYAVPRPPIFPLSMLPHTVTPAPPASGRNSSSSMSKKSNHS